MPFSFHREQPFYNLNDFPDLKELRDYYPTILNELKENPIWLDWGSDDCDEEGHCNFLSGEWKICPIYFGHFRPEEMNLPQIDSKNIPAILHSLSLKFPETLKLLKKIGNINYAAFSRLNSRSKLAPHRHHSPFSLIFHLGLIIPEGCGIKVGEETHEWQKPGEAILFDDNFEHSAWNNSDLDRIILYIDYFAYDS